MKTLDDLCETMEAQLEELREIKEFLKPKKANGKKADRNPIPYEKVRQLYNERCPRLKSCDIMNNKRKQKVRALWKYLPDVERWGQYFARCNEDDYFNGVNYQASIDTILSEDKLIRMFEQGPRSA